MSNVRVSLAALVALLALGLAVHALSRCDHPSAPDLAPGRGEPRPPDLRVPHLRGDAGQPRPPGAGGDPGLRSTSLAVSLTPPVDGSFSIRVQKLLRRRERELWVQADLPGYAFMEFSRELESMGSARVEGLDPGHYRILETFSGVVVDEFEIEGANGTVVLDVDLSKAGYVKGTVRTPAGDPASGTQLWAVYVDPATGKEQAGDRTCVGSAGVFKLRVLGGREIRIMVHHPLYGLRGLPWLVVDGSRSDLAVELQDHGMAHFEVSEPGLTPMFECGTERFEVLLFHPREMDSPAYRLVATSLETGYAFGGYIPGTYTVWLNLPPYEPVLLEDVHLGPGKVELGTIEPHRGADVRLRFEGRKRGTKQAIHVRATYLGTPSYRRSLRVDGQRQSTHSMEGLCPGPWSIRVSGGGGLAQATKRVWIEEEGQTVVQLDPPSGPEQD